MTASRRLLPPVPAKGFRGVYRKAMHSFLRLEYRIHRSLFRPEREWIGEGCYQEETQRALILSLQAQCMDRYETMNPADLIREAEDLDDAYYAAFPPFQELALRYGDPDGTLLYRQRDLYHLYRRRYAAEFGVQVYDVTDERQTGSRRF